MRTLTIEERQLVCQIARQYLDFPFDLVGDGQNTFNCSQFVAKVYRLALDYVLPEKADWLFLKSRVFPITELQMADLVFYCRNPRPRGRLATHVAIYLGDGQIINARQNAGKVLIEPIESLPKHQLLVQKDPLVINQWLQEILSI